MRLSHRAIGPLSHWGDRCNVVPSQWLNDSITQWLRWGGGCGSPTAGGAWLRTRTVWVQIPPAAPKDGQLALSFCFWLLAADQRRQWRSSQKPGANSQKPERYARGVGDGTRLCEGRGPGATPGGRAITEGFELRVQGSEFRAPARKPLNPQLGTRNSQPVVRGCSAWEPDAAVNRVPVGATEVRFLTPPLAEPGSGFRVQGFELRRPFTQDSKPETGRKGATVRRPGWPPKPSGGARHLGALPLNDKSRVSSSTFRVREGPEIKSHEPLSSGKGKSVRKCRTASDGWSEEGPGGPRIGLAVPFPIPYPLSPIPCRGPKSRLTAGGGPL